MQILSLENNLPRRNMLRHALELTGKPYVLSEVASLDEIPGEMNLAGIRLTVIGTGDMDHALSAIVYLRGRMPAAHIIAHGEFSALDEETPARLRQAGADIVLDSRFTPSKMALVVNRFVRETPRETPPANPTEVPLWLLRQAVGQVAPGSGGY